MDGQSTMNLQSSKPLPRWNLLGRFRRFWEERLFPGTSRSTDLPLAPSLVGVVLLASFIFLGNLHSPLLEPQEARYAEISRQMFAQQSWVVPILHGQPYLDKPPLFYWLVAGSYRLFGVHDWAARAVVGVIGVLLVVVTFFWGRAVLGTRAALCAAGMLCLSARFFYLQRMLTMDSLLCLCVIASLASAHRAIRNPLLSRPWWIVAGLCCGLGLLAKGPIALVLVCVPILTCTLIDERSARPGWIGWGGFVLLAIGTAAPWYVALCVQHPDFAREFFWKHHVLRFVEPFDHQKPFWYYTPDLVVALFPWTILLPGFVRFLGRGSRRIRQRRPAALGMILLAGLWPFFFFSLSGCKRPLYIVPAIPPLALALGCYLDVLLLRGEQRSTWDPFVSAGRPPAHLAMTLTLVLGIGVVVAAGIRQMLPLDVTLVTCASLLVGLVAATIFRIYASWACTAIVSFVLLLGAVHWLLPAYADKFSVRDALATHSALYPESRLRVICYPRQFDSVSFYHPNAQIRVYTLSQREELLDALRHNPKTLLLVKSGRVFDDLLPRLPASVEFISTRNAGSVTVGWVRPRGEFEIRVASSE